MKFLFHSLSVFGLVQAGYRAVMQNLPPDVLAAASQASHKVDASPALSTDAITPPASEAPHTPRLMPFKENSFTTVEPNFVYASPKTPRKGLKSRAKRPREEDDETPLKRVRAREDDEYLRE